MAEKLARSDVYDLGRGLFTDRNVFGLQVGALTVAMNCDRDHSDALRRRKGCTLYDHPIDRRVVGIYDHQFGSNITAGEPAGQEHSHLYAYSDGTLRHRLADGSVTDLGGEMEITDTDYASFATIGGDTYIAFGDGATSVYDGEKRWPVGISRPTERPTGVAIPAPGGAGLDGTYRLHLTYIFTTSDGRVIESDGSSRNLTPVVAAANEGIRWTWAGPTDTSERISGYRLYRTRDHTIDDPEYSFLVQIDDITTTTYDDFIPDIELGEFEPPRGQRQTPPENVRLLAFYGNSLWYAGTAENPHRLWYSNTRAWEGVAPDNFIDLPTSSTSRVTGMVAHFGILVVFLEDEIWHVTGTGPSTFSARLILKGIGCVSPASLVVLGGAVAFVSRTGVYAWDGGEPIHLSKQVDNFFKDNTLINLRQAKGVVYRRKTHYYVVLPFTDGNTYWMVLDYSTQESGAAGRDEALTQSDLSRAWFVYYSDAGRLDATAIAQVSSLDGRDEVVLFGRDDGVIGLFDSGYTDFGSDYVTRFQFYVQPRETGRLFGGARSVDQTWRHWVVHTDRWVGTATFRWGYFDSEFGDGLPEPGSFSSAKLIGSYPPISFTESKNRKTRLNLKHHGSGAFVADVSFVGDEFQFLGSEFYWRHNKRGLRGTVMR